MTLYLITRTDSVGYDEFDALVVRAADQAAAAQLACDLHGGSFRRRMFTIEGIAAEGEPEEILGSFNAG